MVHYGPDTHILSYRGSRHAREYTPPGMVTFHYGQGLVDEAVSGRGVPVGWTISDCGNAWRFDACITLYYDDTPSSGKGAIGLDINSDRLAVVETDSAGCPVSRKVIPFSLEDTHPENRRTLSEALEEVFRMCMETANRKRNCAVSLFPNDILKDLVERKAAKYNVAVGFVNPAYTSQIGKVKYMRHYGMSIHESAALVIARRGMGLTEKLPVKYRTGNIPRSRQWKEAYRELKKVVPATVYRAVTINFLIPLL